MPSVPEEAGADADAGLRFDFDVDGSKTAFSMQKGRGFGAEPFQVTRPLV
jgi:hypothetical protein